MRGILNIRIKLREAVFVDFKISLLLFRQFELFEIITKNLVLVILYSHNLLQNSRIAELNTPVKYGIYSI